MAEFLGQKDLCPNCQHLLDPSVHTKDGCEIGWVYQLGFPATQGCECNLSLAPDQGGPSSR